ncbi:jg17937 [Pararge aegeria aegeria]|uniref:Jg17937 protein n=1 Tax=Pararge aegeria aegeria TaxID=348720 RepID=A0A8S4RCS6_9NEOP|nr:jg17937 [Pararge aegeria aegeria]
MRIPIAYAAFDTVSLAEIPRCSARRRLTIVGDRDVNKSDNNRADPDIVSYVEELDDETILKNNNAYLRITYLVLNPQN